jgi:hypothetical protein
MLGCLPPLPPRVESYGDHSAGQSRQECEQEMTNPQERPVLLCPRLERGPRHCLCDLGLGKI